MPDSVNPTAEAKKRYGFWDMLAPEFPGFEAADLSLQGWMAGGALPDTQPAEAPSLSLS